MFLIFVSIETKVRLGGPVHDFFIFRSSSLQKQFYFTVLLRK